MATAASPGRVPAMLRERMTVVELSGYTEAEKRVIATGHLLPLQLARHGLTAEQVQVTGEAVGALIRGYTREPGVWGLAGAASSLCAGARSVAVSVMVFLRDAAAAVGSDTSPPAGRGFGPMNAG